MCFPEVEAKKRNVRVRLILFLKNKIKSILELEYMCSVFTFVQYILKSGYQSVGRSVAFLTALFPYVIGQVSAKLHRNIHWQAHYGCPCHILALVEFTFSQLWIYICPCYFSVTNGLISAKVLRNTYQQSKVFRLHFDHEKMDFSRVIDLFDNVNSRFERDQDHARLQGRGLDWFSR